jgi:hypothetical protein
MVAFRSLTACKMGRERPRCVGYLDFATNSTPCGPLLPAEHTPPTLEAANNGLADKLSPSGNPGAAIVGNVGEVSNALAKLLHPIASDATALPIIL